MLFTHNKTGRIFVAYHQKRRKLIIFFVYVSVVFLKISRAARFRFSVKIGFRRLRMRTCYYLFFSWSISCSLLETVVLYTFFNWSQLQRQLQWIQFCTIAMCMNKNNKNRKIKILKATFRLILKHRNSRSSKISQGLHKLEICFCLVVVVVVVFIAYFVPRAKKPLTTVILRLWISSDHINNNKRK